MLPFIDKIKQKIQTGTELAKNGTTFALKQAEKSIKIESLKVDIASLKRQTDKKMLALANKIYELYENNTLENEAAIEICKDIKMLKWQIDEKWSEIDKTRTTTDTGSNASKNTPENDTAKDERTETKSEPQADEPEQKETPKDEGNNGSNKEIGPN